jgi:hypothetical protein
MKNSSEFRVQGLGFRGFSRSQVYRASDAGYITEKEQTELLEKTDKISRKIGNFIKHLKSSSFKGPKFI